MAIDFDDVFDTAAPPAPLSPRDRCARRLTLKRDDVVTVGKTRWRVEKATGVTAFVVKDGSKGRKLYTLHVTNIDACCIEVREVNGGSGTIKPDVPPVATGCARGEASGFAGARRRRRR